MEDILKVTLDRRSKKRGDLTFIQAQEEILD